MGRHPKNIAFYTGKIDHYFNQVARLNPISVTDTVTRHGQIRNQLSVLKGIMGILSNISPHLTRDKKGYYAELKRFDRQVEVLRDYVNNFNTGVLEDAQKQTEFDFQLSLMGTISGYEEFIEKEASYEPPKNEIDLDVTNKDKLSLCDLKLI